MESFALFGSAPVGIEAYLLVAAILLTCGIVACVVRRNAIGVLVGIELMLNAAILNFMAMWRFAEGVEAGSVEGPLAGIFIVVLSACEAAMALAVLLNLYFNFGTIEMDFPHELEH